jgi:hypothetical protein
VTRTVSLSFICEPPSGNLSLVKDTLPVTIRHGEGLRDEQEASWHFVMPMDRKNLGVGMSLNELLKDPWIMAGATFVATVAFVPLVSAVVKRIRALFGPFSGQYLALTGEPIAGTILVEDVGCRHRGDHLSGTIRGVAIFRRDQRTGEFREVAKNKGEYSFHGFVDERLFVISYRTRIQGVHSAGSIALKGDSSGSVFQGRWAGLVHDTVDDAMCIWVRLDPPVSSKKQRDKFLMRAREYMPSTYGADIDFTKGIKLTLLGERGCGKSLFVNALNDALLDERRQRLRNEGESSNDAEGD